MKQRLGRQRELFVLWWVGRAAAWKTDQMGRGSRPEDGYPGLIAGKTDSDFQLRNIRLATALRSQKSTETGRQTRLLKESC